MHNFTFTRLMLREELEEKRVILLLPDSRGRTW